LTNFNNQKFDAEVEKRLDEIFPSKIKVNKNVKKMREINPIFSLKKVLLSMEWEVTDDILTEYLSEIRKLKRLFRKNKYIQNLLELQYIYGRFIKIYPHNIPLKTYKILYTLYGLTKKILFNNKLSNFEKKKIVKQEIQKYKEIKKYFFQISRNKDFKEVIKKNVKLNELEYIQHLDQILLEMKNFIKLEMQSLKNELFSGKGEIKRIDRET
jgi:hypothetical protein